MVHCLRSLSIQTLGEGVLPEGVRGAGGEDRPAADFWGVTSELYRRLADPWPLNPVGELLLGLKIESRRSLTTARAVASVPGVGFAEWGPSDMAMSFGFRRRNRPILPRSAQRWKLSGRRQKTPASLSIVVGTIQQCRSNGRSTI